jgi:hypothetical protein
MTNSDHDELLRAVRAAAGAEVLDYDKLMQAVRAGTLDYDKLVQVARAGVFEALQRSNQKFTEAVAIFEEGPRTLEMERELQAVVLRIAGGFFADTFGKHFANEYFFKLSSELLNLNEGIRPPRLKPSPIDGRPGDPSNRWWARARVAVALDALMHSGLSETDAVAEIAYKPGLSELAGKNAGNFSTTITNWRREFRKKRVKNSEAAALFAEGVRQIGELAGDPAALRALAANQLSEARSGVKPTSFLNTP